MEKNLRILGNRVLVSKVEEEVKEGFQTVEVQDSFVYKGKIEQIGDPHFEFTEGDIILFAKYSPDTHEISHEGKTYKVVDVKDILAVL